MKTSKDGWVDCNLPFMYVSALFPPEPNLEKEYLVETGVDLERMRNNLLTVDEKEYNISIDDSIAAKECVDAYYDYGDSYYEYCNWLDTRPEIDDWFEVCDRIRENQKTFIDFSLNKAGTLIDVEYVEAGKKQRKILLIGNINTFGTMGYGGEGEDHNIMCGIVKRYKVIWKDEND